MIAQIILFSVSALPGWRPAAPCQAGECFPAVYQCCGRACPWLTAGS
jgi:hypothetical protein